MIMIVQTYYGLQDYGNLLLYKDDSLGVTLLDANIVASSDFSDQFETTYALILHDYIKWGLIQDELDEWCSKHGAIRQGTIVFYSSPEFYTLMKLKYA
jgi:hypothetical protein